MGGPVGWAVARCVAVQAPVGGMARTLPVVGAMSGLGVSRQSASSWASISWDDLFVLHRHKAV